MRHVLYAGLLVACGSANPPAVAPPAPRTVPLRPTLDRIVVVAGHAAGRTEPNVRALRRIFAARHGNVEITAGFAEVDLTVTKVVSGALDDPDYAKRPMGVNALEVVLLDEAAFAAPPEGLDGFEGTWTLTRQPDGTLVASAIGDTPFPRERVTARATTLAQAHRDLHGSTDEERRAGLKALDEHVFFELAPDVMALLDSNDPQVVDEAAPRLRRLAHLLGAPLIPMARRNWQELWHDLATRNEVELQPAPGATVELAKLSTSQSMPDLVASHGVIVVGLTRLEEVQLDGRGDGIALLAPPWQQRTWISSRVQDGLDAATGPTGIAVLSSDHGMDATWRLSLGGRDTVVIDPAEHATHAAIAASDQGFTIAYVKAKTSSVFALRVDRAGVPALPAVELGIASRPFTRWHRGIHPITLARTSGGWLAVVATEDGVITKAFDDSFEPATSQSALLSNDNYMIEPRVIVSKDRAFVAWIRDGKLSVIQAGAGHHHEGDPAPPEQTGTDVSFASRPVALDDGGFAIAWIEARAAVHLGRWDATGHRVTDVLVQAHDVMPYALAVAREGSALLVAYQDTKRYPFSLVMRRIELR